VFRFSKGQQWLNAQRTLSAEVVETSDDGREGTVEIRDYSDVLLTIWAGKAALFQQSGAWMPVG
jgi:hypothetical protein